MNRNNNSRLVFGRQMFSVILLFAVIYLAGCEKTSGSGLHPGSGQDSLDKSSPSTGPVEEEPIPITGIDGIFSQVSGWLTEEEIVYITNNQDGGSSVFLYDLYAGKSSILYKTPYPVISAEISPDSKRILIHSAPSSYEADITIIDHGGSVLFEQKVPSFELTAEWNKADADKILITAFKEDWSYVVYNLNLSNSVMVEMDEFPPFALWQSNEKLYYLDWDADGTSLQVPLKERSLSGGSEKTVLTAAHYLDASISTLLAIETKQDTGTAVYHFFQDGEETAYKLEVPQLSSFSGWIVPEHDWMTDKELLHFQPLDSGEADFYSQGFNLVKYDVVTGSQKVVMEGMENAPLACGPDVEYCLYGFQLEKLINLKTGNVVELTEEVN